MKLYICLYVCVLNCFSHVWLSATPWIIAHQTSLSVRFSRQEYWNGSPYPPPDDLCAPLGNLPHPGIKPVSLTSPKLTGGFFTTRFTLELIFPSVYLQLMISLLCNASAYLFAHFHLDCLPLLLFCRDLKIYSEFWWFICWTCCKYLPVFGQSFHILYEIFWWT